MEKFSLYNWPRHVRGDEKLLFGEQRGFTTIMLRDVQHPRWEMLNLMSSSTTTEVEQWCEANLGKRHKGVYLDGFKSWIGNNGKWRFDITSGGHARIWVRDPELITFVQLVWG